MQEELQASLVRIRTATGQVVGAGFLVGKRQVLTCAHVVSQALDLPDYPLNPPQGGVLLDFPLIAPRTPCTAKVVQWCPPLADGRGDIAGLELQDEPPNGAKVVRFASAGDVWEHPFRAFGFPAGYDDGVWATGRLLGRQAADWVMIEDVKAPGFAVAAGFSGTPVWDTQAQGVVGMVVAASRPTETKTAFVISLDVLAATWSLLTVPQGEPRNPYKGLRPFMQRDADDFFGREAAVEKVADLVNLLLTDQPACSSTRLLTILGPSGAGKSSLVMAGLLPQLQHGALPGSKEWVYLDPMVPGKRPIEALASTLKPHFPDTSFRILREDLEYEAARGLHLLATQLAKQRGNRVVLLIDQCEELFTQTESEDERQRFIQLLLTACSELRGPLLVLLTLRADFYDRPMQYPELFRLIDTQHLSLLAIEPDGLRRVVEQPAALSDVQVTFEGELVNRLLADVQGQAGALPLLQFTLDQLFQRRSGRQLTLSAYRELGGVKGALTRQAEETCTALPSDEHRKLARALFVRLIDPGATEQDTTRRRAALSEFSLTDATQTRLLQETIDAFIAARLLTTNEIAGTTTIEVSHEALIREWPRLADWLREAREDIRLQQTISEDSAEWELHNKPGDRLYRGSRLKDARAWAKRNPSSKQEHAFLQASAARQVRAFIALGAVMLLVVTLSGLAGWSFLNRAHRSNYVTTTDEYATGSLRWAIGTAHAGDTITFDPSLAGQTIVLQNANVHIIQKTLVIQGPTTGHITIREIGASLVVDPPASVIISGVAFQGSSRKNQPFLISNQGKLWLNNCTVSDNTATGGDGSDGIYEGGGGIYNNGGTLNMGSSTVSDNTTTGVDGGGGIFNYSGTITMSNSTVSNNTATGDSGGSGGGIFSTYGTITMSNSTVSDNTATGGNGGGIYSIGGTITMSNSTVSDNTATGVEGGGIVMESDAVIGLTPRAYIAHADLTFSTIYDNTAPSGGDIALAGSIKLIGQVKIRNSIVAGDSAHRGPDIGGMLTSYGYNLFQNNSGATFDPATRTQHGFDKTLSVNDLKIDPVLRDNGGSTKPHTLTHALLPGSPALDAIPLQYCQIKAIFNSQSRMYTDQRSMKRPDDGEDKCDIGAYEPNEAG